MEMKVAATCMHMSQPAVPQSSSSSLASAIVSPRRRRNEAAVVCHFAHRLDRSSIFGKKSSALLRTVSCAIPKSRRRTVRRAASADFDSFENFSDEEFAESLRELAYRGFAEIEAEELEARNKNQAECSRDLTASTSGSSSFPSNPQPPAWMIIRPEPPYTVPASIERKANSVDLPLSLRIIKKRNQWKEDLIEAGESAYSSVNKAFSYMVFIIRELHSYTLQMREFLFLEDVQGILDRVQKEMHDSFVWLFQQIFSHTPTLMMYVMLLMANFTVHSMSNNVAIAAPMHSTTTGTVSFMENHHDEERKQNQHLDSTQIRSSPDSFSSGNGGGNKVKPIGSGTDGGDGNFSGMSSIHHGLIPDELSQLSSFGNPSTKDESATTEQVSVPDETNLWNSIVEEASQMQSVLKDESLDHETMQQFVSPISAEIGPEDLVNYSRIELRYQEAISKDPSNSLLLTNFAQFLFIVVHDHDRAEEYFKRATEAKPRDAEAFSKYAMFLWNVKKDEEAAEIAFQEAIEEDNGNAYHAANYANFLWSSGAEDTCYPN